MIKVFTYPNRIIFNKAANKLTQVIERKLKARQRILLLLSGGSCLNLYQKLSENIQNSLLPWHLVTFAQVDERFNPSDDNEVNANAIEKTGPSLVLRKKNIPHFTISQTGTLKQSADQYNHTIIKLFHDCQFRASVMGVGDDGHTAGLLPGYAKKWNNEKFAVGYENNGKFKYRISISPYAIKQLDYVLILLAGETKRKMLERFIKSSKNESLNEFPAAVLKNIKEIDVLTPDLSKLVRQG